MSRKLDDLHPKFKPLAIELIARCVERGIFVHIVDTLRTPQEHAANLKKGVSWTKHSKHLDGLAIDLCPIRSYTGPGSTKLNWDDVNPEWATIGELGEALGLKWGVWKPSRQSCPDWKRRGSCVNIDLGHFEYQSPPT